MSEEFKKGEWVIVVKLYDSDKTAGLQLGLRGTIAEIVGNDFIVNFGGRRLAGEYASDMGYRLGRSQILSIEHERACPKLTIEAASPVCVLTNAELQAAIEKTHEMRRSTGNPDAVRRLMAHMDSLLLVQLARAEKDTAA